MPTTGNSVADGIYNLPFDSEKPLYEEQVCPSGCDNGYHYEYPGAEPTECEMCGCESVIDVMVD